MDNLVLKLSQGKESLAELVLSPTPGPSPMTVNYLCTLDGDTATAVNLQGVPKRADPLQVAVDALHLLSYPYSGRKPFKTDTKKKGTEAKTPPHLVAQ